MAALVGRDASARAGVARQLLIGATGLLFLVNLYLIFQYAPTAEAALGVQVQRLFYFHVPSALVGFASFGVAAGASLFYLWKRSARSDRLAWASVEVGTVFFTVAIVTGAIWAKPVWQTWWVWDANGSLTFVLWLIFIGYLVVRAYAPTGDRGSRWAAVVAVMGAAAVPFVYMAADWWDGLHTERVTGPGARGSLESPMLYTLIFSLAVFLGLFAVLVAERMAQRSNEESLEELRRHIT